MKNIGHLGVESRSQMQQEQDRDNAECDIVTKDKGDDSKTN